MPCETDLEKAQREFSFLGKPEVYDKIYTFSGFKINNIYNDKIFLEHFSKNISFKVDLFVLKCVSKHWNKYSENILIVREIEYLKREYKNASEN